MMFWRQLGLSDAAAAVLAALIMVFGGGAWLVVQGSRVDPVVVVAPQVDIVVADEPLEETPATGQNEEQAVVEAEVPEVEPVPVPSSPKLDLVRVSVDGDAVVAGTADPNVTIVFMLNGVEVSRTKADSAGSFVGLFEIPASDKPNAITVAAEGVYGGLFSDESVLVAAIAAPEIGVEEDVTISRVEEETETATLAPVTQPLIDNQSEDVAVASDEVVDPVGTELPVIVQDDVEAIVPEVVAAVVADPLVVDVQPEIEKVERDAPTIVVASTEGVKILQPAQQPKAPTVAAAANVVIDTITYSSEGEVALLGRGSGEGFVRIYLNDKPILTTPIEADGTWETPLADVDAGIYQLRVDEVSVQGAVTSRVETPFQREEVELAADAPPTAVTVQPGSTLWAIAKDLLGEGIEYVRVYEANRELIRDPDLIYPGQVFALPTE
jgi:nucleoid-associated protein YgaU